MIRVGTSGFKFDDWKGAFYPARLAQKGWLAYYARNFNCLEVNSTYYRLLHPATFFHMAEKTAEGFLFTVKAYRGLTHEIGPQTPEHFSAFYDSLKPLVEAEKFGCVLAQFPTSFHAEPENLDYIAEFKDKMHGLPLVVEFRNRGWLSEETFSWLKEHGIGFCGVDEPQFSSLMPPVARATSEVGYVRFHGRNYKDWWSGDKNRRYDYLYTEEELRSWLPNIQQLDAATETTFVFMNNCYQAKAAINALQMKGLLEEG
ncbi:MAG: DUF72 domain-containing protein [Armatimonadetes bacterium]|nr:DUF72 domain-containing protein [Armatimonadota bacterium]NIM23703.1 DUF72 domain-containing protein [Armatimonadota bacterium]NIM67580.1 DUF72 domain-containing protein [Armatimonadota bacterium]NIM76103.1 DUF72 domain-containing protein [Armatimonadota bacterium]NIN05786.1 DUF72 domain-containing protein [Armatimonadota bacterium]